MLQLKNSQDLIITYKILSLDLAVRWYLANRDMFSRWSRLPQSDTLLLSRWNGSYHQQEQSEIGRSMDG